MSLVIYRQRLSGYFRTTILWHIIKSRRKEQWVFHESGIYLLSSWEYNPFVVQTLAISEKAIGLRILFLWLVHSELKGYPPWLTIVSYKYDFLSGGNMRSIYIPFR
jgi:hypothetical protein